MQLHYRLLGNGRPLVLLHGLFGSGDNLLPLAQALSTSWQVCLPDLRNHGRSPHSNRHDYRLMMADLIDLLDQLQLPPAAVVGHSMGGKVAMACALTHPQRFSCLVSLDMAPIDYRRRADGLDDAVELLSALPLASCATRSAAMKEIHRLLPERKLAGFFAKNLAVEKNAVLRWRCNMAVLNASFEQLRAVPQEIQHAAPSPLPALFLFGAASDYLTRGGETEINRLFPQNQIVEVAGAGHWLHSDRPQEVEALVRSFVATAA